MTVARAWRLAALAAVVTAFAWGVFVDIEADSPLGVIDLEGQMLLESRARLDGSPLGDWRPGLMIPLQTLILEKAFRWFGLSLETARLAAGIAAILSLILFYYLVSRASSPGVGLAAAALMAANPVFLGVARTALPASFSILFILTTIWIWTLSKNRLWLAALSGALIVFSGLMENGPNTLFMIVAAVCMLGILRLHAWRMPWILATRARIAWILMGVLVMFGVKLWLVVGHWHSFGVMWSHLMLWSLRIVVGNLVLAPTHIVELFEGMPVVALLAVLSFLFYAKSAVYPVFRHRPLNEPRLWFLFWTIAGGLFQLTSSSPQLSSLVLMVPPLCALAADGLARFVRFREVSRPKVDVLIVMLLIGGAVWFLASWLVQSYYHRLSLPEYFEVHRIRGLALLMLLIWGPLTLGLTWVYVMWGQFGFRFSRWQVRVVAGACLATALYHGFSTDSRWFQGRTHELRDARAATAGLTEDDLVVGSWAPLITLGQPCRAAIIWPHINAGEWPWHAEVTGLLLDSEAESGTDRAPRNLFLNRNPRPEPSAYPLGQRRIQLYGLSPVEP